MFHLRVIADKLNIRNTAVAEPTFANWIGDSQKGELHFALKKVKGGEFENVDDWYVDEQNRFYWAGGVVEMPPPLSRDDIIKFESSAKFPNGKIDLNDGVKNIPAEIKSNRGSEVKIGLLDSGIEQKHIDLVSSVESMCDFTNSPVGCNDITNHGSFMASILTAKRYFPEKGIEGICCKAKLVVAKVIYDRDDPMNFKSYADGIAFAVQHGASVINMSFGTRNKHDIPMVTIEIEKAVSKGVILVATARQSNAPVNDLLQYPACHEKVISVAAIHKEYYEANKGNFPKNLILTPRIKIDGAASEGMNFYDVNQGSSVGTAFISAYIALLIGAGHLVKRDKDSVLEKLRQFQSTPEYLFDHASHFLIQH